MATYDGSFGTGDLSTKATIRNLNGVAGSFTSVKSQIDDLMNPAAPPSGTISQVIERNTSTIVNTLKEKEFAFGQETETASALSVRFAHELGIALEDDIAQLYSYLKTKRLQLIEANSSAYSVQPVRKKVFGQASSDSFAYALLRDRNISINPGEEKSSANIFSMHIADQLNQAVEAGVANYVTAIKSQALRLVTESDALYTLTKILKVQGFNVSTESDTASLMRRAFAGTLGQANETETGLASAHVRSQILKLASDGEIGFALDRVLKEQGLPQIVETDAATVLTNNLSRELKQAFEYDEARQLAADRIKFLTQVGTDETAHALGQIMKTQLLNRIVENDQSNKQYTKESPKVYWQIILPVQREAAYTMAISREVTFALSV